MTNQAIGTELASCPFCPSGIQGRNLARHCRKVHGFSDFRIKRVIASNSTRTPVCQLCYGENSESCSRCIGTGCQLQYEERYFVACPICKNRCHKDTLLAHLVDKHYDCFRSTEFPPKIFPTRSPSKHSLSVELNAGLKRQLEARKKSVREKMLKRETVEADPPRVKVVHCHTCGIVIAEHLLGEHVKEAHGKKPKRKTRRKKHNPEGIIKVSGGSLTTVIEKPKLRESICPRCCGDGGVRGGCRKCDGTGWVPAEMERDVPYNPVHVTLDNSRVSNADYLGNNAGGHYRERDGRIGSTPLHDDYSEEA